MPTTTTNSTSKRYATAAKAVGAVLASVAVAQVSHTVAVTLVLSGVVIGGLALVARLTASPVAVSHAHNETWFDQPDGELVVHGARRAAARR